MTRKAGVGYADPDYDLSIVWIEAKARLDNAQEAWGRPETRSRAPLVNGSPRKDGTFPPKMSKSWRLTELAREVLVADSIEAELIDLSLVTSEHGGRGPKPAPMDFSRMATPYLLDDAASRQ